MKKVTITLLLTFGGLFPSVLLAAVTIPPDTVVVAGKQYDRGFVHCLFWGKHYRKVWAEPVKIPYLNLRTEAGGLAPTEKGGSYQTKNLRMVNPEGKEYVLRSVDKDPSQTLSAGMRNSFIGKMIRDQTSVVHPYGAMIVPPLAAAAGVFHAHTKYFIVPDDAALGEFRAEFANVFVMLEERGEGNWQDNPDFGNSAEIQSSRQVFKALIADNKNKADARKYLRSRLFDMWIGDWSRREDQWRWASYKTPNGGTLFKCIPRDRDHAFFKFNDGLFTWLTSKFVTSLQSFGPKIKNLKGLNEQAAPMDKSLLIFLTQEDFTQIADSLQMQLTDPVIENALKRWPENIYKLTGKEFESKLKTRRDQLPEVAKKYYKMLAKKVELPGSDKAEIFQLTGQKDGLLVEVFKPGNKSAPDSLIAGRVFKPDETKTLKIYGLGGDDKFEINGRGNLIKSVVIYDGAGQDEIKFKAEKKKPVTIMDSGDGNEIPKTKKIKVKNYIPNAQEFNGAGWLFRHRLYKF